MEHVSLAQNKATSADRWLHVSIMSNYKVKWVALLGILLLLPVVSLFTHFHLTGDGRNGHRSTTDSICRSLWDWAKPFENSDPQTGRRDNSEGPRPCALPCHASFKCPYNIEWWWVGVADNDEPESTVMKLRENSCKILSEAIDCVISIGADIFSLIFVPFANLVTYQTLCQTCASEKNESYRPLAPALYIFGDSLSDSGNDNFLQTEAKANYRPYGIDFPSGVTGRFTNGKTFADFIAQFLGLPFAPPYLGLSTDNKINIKTGVNYASGSAGILQETGTVLGENLSFNKQIQYFQDTVTNDLPKIFKTPDRLLKYLSKSIFMISIGNNDYLNNYLQPANYRSSQIYTPQQFASLLINELGRGLRNLYSLGARKFLVFNIGDIGCIPSIVNNANPKPSTPCVEDVNKVVRLYNSRLLSMIGELEHALLGSTFVHGDAINATRVSSESGFSFSTMQTPCCKIDGDGMCLPDQSPCQDRNAFTFWDAFHPTEEVYNRLANDCFSGSFSCTPINVQQLAQKQ